MALALDGSNEGADIGGERTRDMRFADDIALLAEQENGLQETLTGVTPVVSQKMGMKVNIQKTECQFLGEGNKKFRLEAEGEELEQTNNFVYLGGNISTHRDLEYLKWHAYGKQRELREETG